MNEIFQLPEFLTMLSYVVLFALAVWVVANAIQIFSEGGKVKISRIRKKCDKLNRFTGKLLERVAEVKRLRSAEGEISSSDQGESQECLDQLRSRITREQNWLAEIRRRGPGNDISSWLREECVDSRVINYFRAEQTEGSAEVTSYQRSLSIPAMIATPAGAAPTMSGTMAFLRDYSKSIEGSGDGGGVLPLSGLNDALFTTWIGCFLTIVSVVLLAYARTRENSSVGRELEEAAAMIRSAYAGWQDAARRAMEQSGGQIV